ncbi:MAG: hypothetical protein NUW23_08970, partial [Firmicutes bacterium]|nr:hypothetical protein [Bacillota bacterium]
MIKLIILGAMGAAVTVLAAGPVERMVLQTLGTRENYRGRRVAFPGGPRDDRESARKGYPPASV